MSFSTEALIEELKNYIDEENIRRDCPMKDYTTFRAGGNAAVLITPKDMAELFSAVDVVKRQGVPFLFLGNGSNVLFTDRGYSGAVIKVGPGLDRMRIEGNVIFAEAGILLSTVAKAAAKESLTGLEFAAGIPGSLGGAVFMNAGAYGGELKDVIRSVSSLGAYGMMHDRPVEKLDLSYRHSIFMENGELITGIKLVLRKGDPMAIEAAMADFADRRREKQPLNMPSAGSFFKRPEGNFAGRLIEQAGLKGLEIGGAMVSPVHAGFIVNKGDAKAGDIIDLMMVIMETVLKETGVLLEPEVRIVGE